MARRTIDIDGETVTVSPLEPPSVGRRHAAILPSRSGTRRPAARRSRRSWADLSDAAASRRSVRVVDERPGRRRGQARGGVLADARRFADDLARYRRAAASRRGTLTSRWRAALRSLTGPSGDGAVARFRTRG